MTQILKRYLNVYAILLTLGVLTLTGCAQELTDPNANTRSSNLSGEDGADEVSGDYDEPCGEEPSCEDDVLATCTDPETGELDECCYEELIEGCYEEVSCDDLAIEECTDPETGELDEGCFDEVLEWCEGGEELSCEDIAFEECLNYETEELDEGCVDEVLGWCEGEVDEWDDLLAFCEEIAISEAEAMCLNEDGELDEECFERTAAELFDACVSDTEESIWLEQEIIATCEQIATDTGFEYCTDEEGYVDVECFEAVRDDAFAVCLEEGEAEMGEDDARWEAILDACVGLAEDLVIVFCEPEDEGCFEETFDAIVNECLAEAGAALEEQAIYEDIHDACSAMAEEEASWECVDDEGNLNEDCFWMLYDGIYSECFAASEESWSEEAAMWEEVFYTCESLADEGGWLECTDEEGNTDEECHADVSLGVFEECMAEAEAAMAEGAARVDACAGLADEVAMDECAIEEDIDFECYDEVASSVFDECLGVEEEADEVDVCFLDYECCLEEGHDRCEEALENCLGELEE